MAKEGIEQDSFRSRHIGPRAAEVRAMLDALGYKTLDDFISMVVPSQIRSQSALKLSSFLSALSEKDAVARLKKVASQNEVRRSFIGAGYYGTITPPVILRNILENPGWYTQYTPYQAEIAQGRLEALLNFQTMVSDLTGLPIANASLLDEGTAAAEAMSVCLAVYEKDPKSPARSIFVDEACHPQTIAVMKTRAAALGVEVKIGRSCEEQFTQAFFAALVQYPDTFGEVADYRSFTVRAHNSGALVIVASDLLALSLLTPPGEIGADFAVGSAQRFGVPMGFGGPHAAFFAAKDEYKRIIPGRIIGVSKDSSGEPALRLALQTREQHIRRERATSNICTAQVLLAVMAGMYAVYHGPEGIRRIARRVHALAKSLAVDLQRAGLEIKNKSYFDTITVSLNPAEAVKAGDRAREVGINLRDLGKAQFSVSLDESADINDLRDIFYALTGKKLVRTELDAESALPKELQRKTEILAHPVFNTYHSETEFLRYVRRLESRDLSLGFSMIPLGSCTMKLNATSEMLPVTWPEFYSLHPFAPKEQSEGYAELFRDLEKSLAEVTGFDAVSLQPNAGSQGEYAGLLAIRGFHEASGQAARNICLIPKSAHGTNPASAVMAGLKVVVVDCDEMGNVSLPDLTAKVMEHRERVAALMVTYPSTHGVFEEEIKEICKIVHEAGGQVYMDGANLNALVGLSKPAELGADVCHINLHKTFCIPHGGGGPGMGPIAVKAHLEPFLPSVSTMGVDERRPRISAAAYGSASILVIPWMYMAMMGGDGLTEASKIAILNANYIAKRLEKDYSLLFKGKNGLVAHECILDLRELKDSAGVEVEDVAKRLIDYGFHAPTVSWPVPGTIMIEPTESESKAELDRFCEALIRIRGEAAQIASGKLDRADNPLKNAPHTARSLASESWTHPYTRETAAFPAPWTKESKFWPAVGRVDNAYGDKNLVCACLPIEAYKAA